MGSQAISSKDFIQIAAMLVVGLAVAMHSRGPQVNQISLGEAKTLMEAGALVIDVREAGESHAAHVPGALLVPLERLTATLPQLALYRDKPVVVYCNGGVGRGPKATALLMEAGFSQAVNLELGFQGWRKAGLPTKAGSPALLEQVQHSV